MGALTRRRSAPTAGATARCATTRPISTPGRPACAVDLLVIHNISLPAGRFGGPHIADLFTNRVDFAADPSFADLRGLTVSAHFLVRRDGRVIQFVSCNERAWHAGVSQFRRPRTMQRFFGRHRNGRLAILLLFRQRNMKRWPR